MIFGSGPGALPSDAYTLGIDPMVQRDRQDEAIGVIMRLLAGERVTHESDWFTLRDARLQLLPLQEDMPLAVASQISPSGMTLAGKYGTGVLSIGSMSTEGLMALPTQWSFAEEAAAKARPDRRPQELARGDDLAPRRDPRSRRAPRRGEGLLRWHNEYNVGTLHAPGRGRLQDARRRGRPDRRSSDGAAARHRHARRPGEGDPQRCRRSPAASAP